MPVWSQGLVTVAVGASLGLLAAQAVSYVCRRWTASDESNEYHFAAGLAIVGVALGWQAVLTTLLFASVLKLVWSLVPIRAPRIEPLATENITIPNEEISQAIESQDSRQEQSVIEKPAISEQTGHSLALDVPFCRGLDPSRGVAMDLRFASILEHKR
jgi:hypothetical protein